MKVRLKASLFLCLNIYVVTITSSDIKNILCSNLGINVDIIHTPDTFYNLMREQYIDKHCYPKYKEWLETNTITKWDRTFDCDNYAESFRVYVQITHSKYARNIRERQSLWSSAFGVIWYKRNKRSGHAINIQIIISNKKYKIRFIEPQTGKEIKLTPDEIKSIFFIII